MTTRRRRKGRRASVGVPDTVIETRNPIPLGVYWVDLDDPPGSFTSPAQVFRVWCADNGESVEVLNQQSWTSNVQSWGTNGVRKWVLFRVKTPVMRWPDDSGIGRPVVATNNVAPRTAIPHFEERKQENVLEKAEKKISTFGAGVGTGTLLVLLVLWALRKGLK